VPVNEHNFFSEEKIVRLPSEALELKARFDSSSHWLDESNQSLSLIKIFLFNASKYIPKFVCEF